jgi:hypothetical protein
VNSKEYRYHYIKIDKEEQAQTISDKLYSMLEVDEIDGDFTEDNMTTIGNILYAVNGSFTGGNGDSYYNPTFKDDVKYISTMFPEITFTAGWTNPEDKEDKEQFTIINNDVIGNQEVDKAKQMLMSFYEKAREEYDRLEQEFEEINRTNPSGTEWATLQDAMIIYSNIIDKLRREYNKYKQK